MASRGIGEILIGAAVLLVAAGFIGFAVAHSGRTAASGYKLYASFDHIDGLNPGADVRIAGVKVGNVLDMRVDPKTFLAKVTLSVIR
jgi:phospholipid/cholesterol/gamma-HCH transport system substrate-binding protein